MGTTADKLQAVLNSKRAIKQALIAKGAAVTDQTKFSQYGAKIAQLSADTSAFEAAALAIIGDESTIPDIPAPDAPVVTSSCKFYKCTSVDTANKTWTGYELILQDGVYVVSDVETTGLTYAGFTPSVNTMYNEDATFIISNLFSKSETLEGCVFAANMQSNAAMYNGETINLDGVNLVEAPGYTDGTKALNSSIEFPFDGTNDFADGNCSVAFSAYLSQSGESSQYFVRGCYSDGYDPIKTYQYGNWEHMTSKVSWSAGSAFNGMDHDIGFGWHHIVIQSKGNEYGKIFVDGVAVMTVSETYGYDNPSSLKQIVRFTTSLSGGGCMKDLQIYNRALDPAEVEDLYEKAKLPTA